MKKSIYRTFRVIHEIKKYSLPIEGQELFDKNENIQYWFKTRFDWFNFCRNHINIKIWEDTGGDNFKILNITYKNIFKLDQHPILKKIIIGTVYTVFGGIILYYIL